MMLMVIISLLLYTFNAILSSTQWSSKGFLPLRQIKGIVCFGYIYHIFLCFSALANLREASISAVMSVRP
jgi:hypothetical protein